MAWREGSAASIAGTLPSKLKSSASSQFIDAATSGGFRAGSASSDGVVVRSCTGCASSPTATSDAESSGMTGSLDGGAAG